MTSESSPSTTSELDNSLAEFARQGDAYQTALCLAAGANAKANESAALAWAATHGHADCVELLIPLSDPRSTHSIALLLAAENGHAKCVELLIPVSGLGEPLCIALALAAENGHVECAKILLPIADAKHKNFYALQKAAFAGHGDCVSLLLPESAPLLDQPGFISDILWRGRADIVARALAFKPSLLDHLDLWHCWDNAGRDGNLELASFLNSLIERRSIAESASSLGPLKAAGPRL